ncbi:tandem five-TM protein [Staphylococcus aureus]|uniref:DUF443 domain-containing protein n=1 Tax=Staphylococcus aureus TaxID=1280 RepID=UPI0005C2F514|nr:DUF443 domain-containing protein [Staphylococcus aureus]KIU01065.1 tandem five-TM protein [Staphylococcus aureus]
MLCESRVINQNPKYRIIKYNNEYFMVDLVSTWIAYFLPMINWFIPKKYAKISREEFESLNIVKPAKNNTFWPVAGFAVLLTTLTRKYIYLLNIHLEKEIVILTCCMILLAVFTLFLYLNKKLKLHMFEDNKNDNDKIILIPTFKNICLSLIAYVFFGGFSIMLLSMLMTLNPQNIIGFLALFGMIAAFFIANRSSIIDKNVYAILRSKEVEK